MNTNVLNKLTYGLYILSSKYKDKPSGCIIDACIQAGSNPDRILISVMHSNYTREIIEMSGVFCVSVLAESCPFELIKHFGFQSSRNVDKFDGLTNFTDINGVPCILSNVCAVISARVVDVIDLGSHTVFIGEVKDQKFLDEAKPMTYAYYQEKVKPTYSNPGNNIAKNTVPENAARMPMPQESQNDQKIIGWKCTICGFVYSDPVLPDDYQCPVCGHPSSDFVPIYE